MTITSSPLLSPEDVARHSFTTVRKGFDPKEVRAYLESLANGIANLSQREQQLLEELAAADRRAENPVLDEQTLVTALGQHTAKVIQSAHEVASELESKAREEAERLVSDATERAEAVVSEAESRAGERTSEAEAAAARMLEEAEARSAALVEAARAESDELRSRTKEECRAMLEEVQQLRARVIADLSRRRRALHSQIEQLRAGRERLAETIDGVRRSVDVMADDLLAAEDNAREAAEAAAREVADRVDEEPLDDLAQLLQATADEPGAGGAGAEQAGAASGRVGEPPEGTSPEESAGTRAAAGKVDELFARLRADQGAGPAATEQAEAGAASEADGGPGHRPGSRSDTPDTETQMEPEPEPQPVASAPGQAPSPGGADGSAQPEAQAAHEPEDGGGSEPGATGPPAGRPPVVVQRDELIAPVVTALSRRLKRTLQDTQNDMLDQLRSNGSRWSPAVLPDETEQLDGFATAVVPVLEDAAQAGASFAGGSAAPPADELVAVAHGLAEEVVSPLRRRLSDDDGVAEAGEAGAMEHVGAAFREWRGPRVERLAGDYVVAAFSLGSMTALRELGDEGRVEWVSVPGSGDAPCPDCEDNGLAGPQPPGESFPTGHRHPPAHSGCRCLVAPAAP